MDDVNQCRMDAMIPENQYIKQKKNIVLKLGISQERKHHLTEKKLCQMDPAIFDEPMKQNMKTVFQELN